MKKVLLFIVLKVLEVIGAVAAYFGLSYLGYLFAVLVDDVKFVWYSPAYFFVTLLLFFMLLVLYMLIYVTIPGFFKWWFKSNKNLVNRILKK